MNYCKRTSFIGTVVLLMAILAILAPISVPGASAHTLTPLSTHSARRASGSGPHHLAIPLDITSNCNFDGPTEGGFWNCGVESIVAPGCLIEHTTPFALTTNRTGNCYRAGTVLGIICQTRGGTVNNATNVWDFLVDTGAYVTDFYMDTSGMNGAFSPPIPQC